MTVFLVCDFILDSLPDEKDLMIEAEFPILPQRGDEIDIRSFMDEKMFKRELIEQCSELEFVVSRITWAKNEDGEAAPIIICESVIED